MLRGILLPALTTDPAHQDLSRDIIHSSTDLPLIYQISFSRSVLYQTKHLPPSHKFYRTWQNPPARISSIADRKYQCHSFLLLFVIKSAEAHHHDSHWCLHFQRSNPNRLSIFCFLKLLRPMDYGKCFLSKPSKFSWRQR